VYNRKTKNGYAQNSSNSKSLGYHVVSPEEGKVRLQWEGFADKEGFRPMSGMKERVGDGKLIIISMTVKSVLSFLHELTT